MFKPREYTPQPPPPKKKHPQRKKKTCCQPHPSNHTLAARTEFRLTPLALVAPPLSAIVLRSTHGLQSKEKKRKKILANQSTGTRRIGRSEKSRAFLMCTRHRTQTAQRTKVATRARSVSVGTRIVLLRRLNNGEKKHGKLNPCH